MHSIELQRHPDSHLWWTALGLALLVNTIIFVVGSLCIQKFNWRIEIPPKASSSESEVATLYLEAVASKPDEAAPPKPQRQPFARTSPDQPSSDKKTHERIGERNTQATSERPADPTAEALPSQYGIEPEDREIETTESRYQDGELIAPSPDSPTDQNAPSAPSPPSNQSLADAPSNQAQPQTQAIENSSTRPPVADVVESTDSTLSEERSLPPLRETLLVGPDSVDVNVPREQGESERPKQTPLTSTLSPSADVQPPTPDSLANAAANPAALPKPKAFQGNQRKTAMVGSISRTGRSALNVDDSELGRYQAAISKAVELEWQRNCIRHRDFITPGFLTVRFYVEPSGRVKSVNFVGDAESGEVQKGFTLSAIREADIPKMPDELAKAFADDTLELVFRFYF